MKVVFRARGRGLAGVAFVTLVVSCGRLPAPTSADGGAIAPYRVTGLASDATVAFQQRGYPPQMLERGPGSPPPPPPGRFPLTSGDTASLHITIGTPNAVSGTVSVDERGRVEIALIATLGEVPNDGKAGYKVDVHDLDGTSIWSDAGSRLLCHVGCSPFLSETLHQQLPQDKLAAAADVSIVVSMDDRPIGSPPPSPFAAPF